MNPIVATIVTAFALFAWVSPNHYVPWPSFHGQVAMASAFVIAGLMIWQRDWVQSSEIPQSAAFLAAIGVIPLIQFAAGQLEFAGDLWLVLVHLVGLAFAVALGFRCFNDYGQDRTLRFFTGVVLIGALLSAWLALYQWQRLDYLSLYAAFHPAGARIFANFAQSNHLATMFVLGVVSLCYLHVDGRINRAVSLMALALFSFGLAMTQSRMGLLSITVVAAFLCWQRESLGPRLQPRHVAVGLATVFTFVALWMAISTPEARSGGRDLAAMGALGLRPLHWSSMLDAIGRRPWIGYGWGQVGHAQFAVAADHPATGEILKNSHNLILDLMVWNGVPIGALLTFAVLWWLRSVLRSAREPASVLALGAVLAFGVHNMLEFPYEYAYFLLPMGLLAGLLTARAMPHSTIRLPRVVLPVGVIALAVLVGAVARDYLILEEEMRVIRLQEQGVGRNKPRAEHEPIYLLTQLDDFFRFARTPEKVGMTAEEIEWMGAVVRRNPYSYSILRYASALALNGRPAEAAAALAPICKTHPTSLCDGARLRWSEMGAREPRIAAVQWPDQRTTDIASKPK